MLRKLVFFTIAAIVWVGCVPSVRADEETDRTLATIETAVKAKKASPKMLHQWVAFLNDADSPIAVKERAAWGLGYVGKGNTETIPALLKAAEHKGLLVRSAAVNSLIRLRTPRALPILEKIAREDPILGLRRDATLGLGLLESDKAIDALVNLSVDKTPEVRGASALAMAALQSKRNNFKPALQEMTTDENPYVQERAKNGLAVAERKNEAVRSQLASSDQDVRLFAALYFLRHGTAGDKKAIQAAYDGESDEDVRKMLSEARSAVKKRSTTSQKKKTHSATSKKKTKPT